MVMVREEGVKSQSRHKQIKVEGFCFQRGLICLVYEVDAEKKEGDPAASREISPAKPDGSAAAGPTVPYAFSAAGMR